MDIILCPPSTSPKKPTHPRPSPSNYIPLPTPPRAPQFQVGKTNPDAKLGYAGSKRGRNGEELKSADDLPSSVVIQLSAAKSGDDDAATTSVDEDADESSFPPIDVPIDTNTSQLEALVNSLLNGDDDEDEKKKTQTTPYAFYLSRTSPSGETVEDIEIATSLTDAIKRANALAAQSSSSASPISTEAVIKITYQVRDSVRDSVRDFAHLVK